MTSFLKRQITEIKREGLFVLLKKVYLLSMSPLALLGVILVRILRPLVVVRFGPLPSSRIGHLAANTEVYLCERDAGIHGRRNLDIFFHIPPVCNRQLTRMWDRTIHVCSFAGLLYMVNRFLPGWQKHIIPWRTQQDRDIHNLLSNSQPHLRFTKKEESLGINLRRKMGIPDDVSFVCFHARDSSYLNNGIKTVNWDYHNYRDANIQNYIPAAEELVRRGYITLRMGAIVKEPLNSDNSKIIDYARKGRDDFLDIYLLAKCRFFIGSNSGITVVPMIFRRPIAWTNCIPLDFFWSWSQYDLVIPKRLKLRKEDHFLTFREILHSEIGRFLETHQYGESGIEIVENTPEEIKDLVTEMDERLNGTWQTTEEDEELQRRFRSLFKPSELHGKIVSRIGAKFLRQNLGLLN